MTRYSQLQSSPEAPTTSLGPAMWLRWLFLIDPSVSTATGITWAVSDKHAISLAKKAVPGLWLDSFNSTSQDNVLGNVSEGNVGSNIPSEWASTEPGLFKTNKLLNLVKFFIVNMSISVVIRV